jgi:SsrA-binding protein
VSTKKDSGARIASNKKARHDYFIEDTVQAGLVLEGWEVKAIREGKMRITESYVVFRNNEAYLFGAHIQPLLTSSTHVNADPLRTRKLLLSRREIDRLMGVVDQKGHTCLCLSIYWSRGLVKADVAIGVGKKLHDKRETLKDRDWAREKQRGFKNLVNQ